jgi:transcriptional regulator with XRE-family HTH domain
MKERILKLITHLGYTATKFADEIGVQRSGISHILSGRNQPSYDFIVKILNKFPDLDAEWLILGKGLMLKSKMTESNTNIFTTNNPHNPAKQTNFFKLPADKSISKLQNHSDSEKVTNVTIVHQIVVLNSDGTFQVYNQAKKD